jgi:hypothetical protein
MQATLYDAVKRAYIAGPIGLVAQPKVRNADRAYSDRLMATQT